MEIIVGNTAGFCYGVKNAVEKTLEELKKDKNIYCLGEIVHNRNVVNDLEQKGLKVIENLKQNQNHTKTIIRAHGVGKSTYDEAKNNNIELIDLTCPNVIKIHKIVSDYEKRGYFIYVIGNKTHPEILGTVGFCGNNFCIIEHEEDIMEAKKSFEKTNKNNVLVIVQTTFSLEKFNKFTELIKTSLSDDINIEIANTICNATKVRQEETDKISKVVDYMIVIGGKNSSNTKKLYEISKKNCSNVVCIEDYKEINTDELKDIGKIGIMAGASTPQSSIKEVIDILKDV